MLTDARSGELKRKKALIRVLDSISLDCCSMRGSIPLSSAKLNKMSDKEALQKIVYMVNDYVNFADHVSPMNLIDDLIKFLEQIK